MRRALLVSGILVAGWLLVRPAAAQDGRAAPPPEVLEERAEQFRSSRRTGAWMLWGGLLVSSVIIGVVRGRKRRRPR